MTLYGCEHLLVSSIRSAHGDHLQDVEPHSLRERPALANDDLVALLHTEGGRDVGSQVGVSLLVPLVLSNEVEVIPSNSDGAGHFCAVHGSGKDAATDGHISGEWALLVNVSA